MIASASASELVERLLAHDVLAGAQRRHHHRVVQRWRRADHHDVDVRPRQQVVVGSRPCAECRTAARRRRAARVGVAAGEQRKRSGMCARPSRACQSATHPQPTIAAFSIDAPSGVRAGNARLRAYRIPVKRGSRFSTRPVLLADRRAVVATPITAMRHARLPAGRNRGSEPRRGATPRRSPCGPARRAPGTGRAS